MKIVVKSTKTISFDDAFDDDESSEHENNESEREACEQEEAYAFGEAQLDSTGGASKHKNVNRARGDPHNFKL